MDKYAVLREAVEKVELVDGHAHNIVDLDSSFPFLRCFSEAEGDALSFAFSSLSFKRSLRDIAELYGCEASLHGIETHRRSLGLQSISSKCFGAAKIVAVLIDDGLISDKMHELEWHRSFVPVVHRVLRIEHLAQMILNEDLPDGSKWTLDMFTETFVRKLKSVADRIVALKSIVAYRTGLGINPNVDKKDAEKGLNEVLSAGKPVRIQNKSLIDHVFVCSLEVALGFDLPIQIHTGFGDKDLDLRLANPLHLRALLQDSRFSKCRIILLHASYPFSKEASYLASVYQQIYLDFGLAVPKLSVHGMKSSVKELLELSPIKKGKADSKCLFNLVFEDIMQMGKLNLRYPAFEKTMFEVMFSTDGYAFPETFYLGAKRAREVVLSVLCDACEEGDLSIPEALEAVEDIFKNNAIQMYNMTGTIHTSGPENAVFRDFSTKESNTAHKDTVFVRIIWVDTSGQHRCRAVPAKRFHDIVKNNGIGLTFASMGMTSFSDGPADGTNLTGVGEIRLMPDLSTKWRLPWSQQEEMVLADMHIKPGKAWDYCPREALRRVTEVLKEEFNLEMNAGFENEFFLLRNVSSERKEEWVPFDSTPYCSTSGFDAASPILRDIYSALQSLNVPVEQIHAESGKGQFEIALGHRVCTVAADNLIFTREVIRAIARKHGLLATFVPKYSLDDIGSGSHVHLSLWENGKNVFMASGGSSKHGISKIGEEFMAGVLYHLPSLLAFTAPIPNSYDRIQPNTWSGAYRCWGKENREAPLRTACPPGIADGLVSNFEIKSFDGCANPYLSLAAVIAAGIDGLRRHLSLPEPIETNPSSLDGEIERLPKELSESVEALEKDEFLKDLIDEKLLTAVIGVRKAEVNYYSKNKDAFKQLIHRY